MQNCSLIDEVKMELEVKEFEEERPKIQYPGFFEVFPELRMKWPKWSRDKRGNAIPCASDTDCPFPQTCCDHPIIPRERKYCCTGWGQRQMIPAYVHQVSNYLSDNTNPSRRDIWFESVSTNRRVSIFFLSAK